MKVDLDKIVVGIGLLTNKAYAGVLNKKKDMWLHKVDVDETFVHSVIQRWKGTVESISYQNGDTYEISVKEIKKKK